MCLNMSFRKCLFFGKRGMFAQVIIALVVIFALGIVYSLTFMAQSVINTEVQADTTMDNQSKSVLQEQTNAYPGTFDSAVGLLSVIIWVIVLALAYKGSSNPLFIIIAVFVIAALGFVGMVLANVWYELDSDVELGGYTSSFPITDFLLSNFLVYVLVVLFSGVMVYAFSNGGIV